MSRAATLVAHEGLCFFLSGPIGSEGRALVPVDTPRSVKDAFESAGIPHPEVHRTEVDGREVGFAHVLSGGERLDLHPPPPGTPPPDPSVPPDRFVCDVHLGRLARRLRLLGFDTWYANSAEDEQLAGVSVAECRILLTRDRGLLMRRVVVAGYCPRSDDPDDQVTEVVARYGLAERLAPLTRCARCNGRLHPAAKADVLDLLPPRTRVEHDRFARCTRCGQVYWPGTHLRRISDIVARAASA